MKHWSENELAAAMKELTVIIDTREQVNPHILWHFRRKGIKTVSRKLDVGDYSAQIGEETFERTVVVERKASLDELCGNLTADRDRFEREFLRAKAYGVKVFLLIENTSWDDVYMHNYRSRLSEKSLLASLMSWQVRFNVTIIMANSDRSGALIHGILYYAVREVLLYG